MIFLYILLGIILFFCLLFALDIRVYVALDSETRLRAGVGPIVLTLMPRKRKKVNLSDFSYKKYRKRMKKDREKSIKKKTRAKKKKIASQAKKVEAANAEGNSALTLAEILALVELIKEELGTLFGSVTLDIRRLSITAVGDDAAEAAVNYGKVCALTSATLAILDVGTKTKIRDGAVQIGVDYTAKKQKIALDIYVKVKIFSIVRAGWHVLLHVIGDKINKKTKKSS